MRYLSPVSWAMSETDTRFIYKNKNTRDWYLFHLCGFTIPLNLFQMLRKIEKYLELSIIIPIFAA
jgi:hypothetical protein